MKRCMGHVFVMKDKQSKKSCLYSMLSGYDSNTTNSICCNYTLHTSLNSHNLDLHLTQILSAILYFLTRI